MKENNANQRESEDVAHMKKKVRVKRVLVPTLYILMLVNLEMYQMDCYNHHLKIIIHHARGREILTAAARRDWNLNMV